MSGVTREEVLNTKQNIWPDFMLGVAKFNPMVLCTKIYFAFLLKAISQHFWGFPYVEMIVGLGIY